jgi:hypothetical protein
MRSKNAFLITVFKQIDILCLFIEKHPSNNFYIHVDKKSESKNIFLEHLSKYENVCLVTRARNRSIQFFHLFLFYFHVL